MISTGQLPYWLTDQLSDQLPPDWHIPGLYTGFQAAIAVTPDRSLEYHLLIGGEWEYPRETKVGGRVFPPHTLAIALWRLAKASPGQLLAARVPTLEPGTWATGLKPDEVKSYPIADPEMAVDWIYQEARRLHAAHPSAGEYLSNRARRDKLQADELARQARIQREAEIRQKLGSPSPSPTAAPVMRRGHRVG